MTDWPIALFMIGYLGAMIWAYFHYPHKKPKQEKHIDDL